MIVENNIQLKFNLSNQILKKELKMDKKYFSQKNTSCLPINREDNDTCNALINNIVSNNEHNGTKLIVNKMLSVLIFLTLK